MNLEIIDNKISNKKYTLSENLINKILKIVSNIDTNYVIYYDLIYNIEKSSETKK